MNNWNLARSLILSLCAATMVACASRPLADNCAQRDWYELGRRSGAVGESSGIGGLKAACGKKLEAGTESVYANGYNAGLAEYCQAANGFALGRSGVELKPVCPAPLDRVFAEAHRRGKEARKIESDNSQLNRQISSISAQLDKDPEPNSEAAPKTQDLRQQLSQLESRRERNERRLSEILSN